nr:hypothetical protein [uncultured Desulfuromonas sp.]
MGRPQKIPASQLKRVHRLELMLEEAANNGELEKAKLALDELKVILSKFDHRARILQGYLKLYEASLEAWELGIAQKGFEYVRKNTSKKTRTYLEATALLAIAHLREQNLQKAEPFIVEVLKNDSVIKSKETRIHFRKEIIERFDQEGILAALAKILPESYDNDQIHKEALALLMEGKNEEDLQEIIGARAPQSVKDFLFKIDQFGKNILPHHERLLLPSPKDIINNRQAGGVIFAGIKRRAYKYICDEKSEVYQAWVHGGIDAVLSKGYVASAVVGALTDVKIGMSSIAVGISALLMKHGITNFCERNRPTPIMGLRKKSNQ